MKLSSAYIKVFVLATALILGCAVAAYGADTQSPADSLQSLPRAHLLTATPPPFGLRPLDGSPTAETPTFRVFLPNIQKPIPTATPTTTPTPTPTLTPSSTPTTAPVSGIYGRVTLNGAPAGGIFLKLRSWTGSTYLDVASTTTDASGNFSFVSVPPVPSGQKYSVNCGGQGAGTLLYWNTRSLNAYTPGSSVHIGDFDIANVALVSPTDRATVSLPTEFRWTPRPASPTDSYVWAIFNSSSYWPWYWGPSLGYIDSYTRYSLPSGFNLGTQYTWYVEIHSPDGGYGASLERRGVTFTGALEASPPMR